MAADEVTDWIQLQRRSDERLSLASSGTRLGGTRRPGRHTKRWADDMLKFLRDSYGMGVDETDWMALAHDKEAWTTMGEQFANFA